MSFDTEIVIPVLEIVPGWDVDDLETIEDCEDAHVKLMCIIAEIEYQIDSHDARMPIDRDLEWVARAKRALKYKRAAAQCVNNKRGRIGRAQKQDAQDSDDRRLLAIIKAHASREDWNFWCRLSVEDQAA